jgi:hypothetical protein
MSNTLKLGNGQWATGKDTVLAYNDLNSNYKPLAFSFSRASSGTVVNKDGLIETVGSGEPRIDFKDNTKGALLLEPQRSNLITYSEDFSQWTNTRSSDSNGFVSPTGGTNATKLISDNTASSSHIIKSSNFTILSGQKYTYSVFVKANQLNYVRLLFTDATVTNTLSTYFNLSNGTVGTTSDGSTATLDSSNIENFGNGWFRCSVSGDLDTTTTAHARIYLAKADNDAIINGDGVSGIYIYGAQLEQGSYATSYIPTSGQANGVTRVADNITQPTPNLSNSQEVTAFIDLGARPLTGINTTSNNFRLDFGTGSTRIIYNQNTSNYHRIELNINGSSTYYTLSNLLTTTRAKIGISLTPTTLVIYANGVEYHSVSIGSADWSKLLKIETSITDAIGNIKINDFKFYNTALTNQELIALTQ